MSLDILKNKIKSNDLSGVYLLCGSEEYTKDHYASLIRKKVDDSPLPEFNHIYFDASSGKISDLEDAVNLLPYMWDNKLIEITDLESARITESDIDEYARIFSELPDYVTILVVLRADEHTEEARNTTSKSGLFAFCKTVKDHGLVVEFKNEKSDKLTTWIAKHFTTKNIKFDPNVPKEMINYCGNDMYILQSEILKLSEVYDGVPLKASDVRKYCCANSSYKYFDIAAALNRRDMVTAKRILDSLDLNRDEIPLALGYIAKNYSDMLIVKSGIDSGKGFDTIEKETKIKRWQIEKISNVASSVDMRALSFAISQLANADIKLKSYHGNPHRILELAFYRICTYGRKA